MSVSVAKMVLPEGAGKEKVSLNQAIFGVEYNPSLVKQVSTAYAAGARQGSKATKGRSDVRGSGAKRWRQKGTGRARTGDGLNNIWRGGGTYPQLCPRDFSQKVNKKMHKKAMQCLYSRLATDGVLSVVDKLEVKEPKTKVAKTLLANMNQRRLLIIVSEIEANLLLATRNLQHIEIVTVDEVNPLLLMWAEQVLIVGDALANIEGRLSA